MDTLCQCSPGGLPVAQWPFSISKTFVPYDMTLVGSNANMPHTELRASGAEWGRTLTIPLKRRKRYRDAIPQRAIARVYAFLDGTSS